MPATESPLHVSSGRGSASAAPHDPAPRLPNAAPRRLNRRETRALAALALATFLAGPTGCGGITVIDVIDADDPRPPDGAGGASTTSTGPMGSTGLSTSASTGGVGGAPSIPPLVEVDFGEVPLGGTVAFNIPPGTLGFTAVAELLADFPSQDLLGIQEIDGPDGRQLAADYTVPSSRTLARFANFGIALAAVPQTSFPGAMPIVPGDYRVTIGDFDGGTRASSAHLTLWRRQTLDGRFHGGTLDVNLFIAGDAISESAMASAVKTAFEGFIGLNLGELAFHSLGPEWDFIDENNFQFVLEQTAGAEGKPALNIIAVSQIGGQLEGAAGVTPSAPAYALKHGTHASAIVVSMFEDAGIDTIILRHELGHFAGLFHTSEFDPGFGDALDDTALCDDVGSQFEGCPDTGNLMFPSVFDLSATLSPQQTTVMQASTFYRGIVEDGGGPASPLSWRAGGTGSDPPAASTAAPASPAGYRSQPQGAWATAFSPPAARLLAGHFCGQTPTRTGTTFFSLLAAAGAADPARLLALGADPSAPPQARSRALSAAGRAAPSPRALAELQALAADPRLPRAVRLGAIEGVANASLRGARTLASRLTADRDPVVARMATRAAGL